ncbi:MAG: hypothetical protein Q9181_002037 [Wetmoreana brouardii]
MADSKKSDSLGGDNREQAVKSQTLDPAETALKDLDINARPNGEGKSDRAVNEGKTIIDDVNLPIPKDAGYDVTQRDGEADGDFETYRRPTGDKGEGKEDGIDSVAQDMTDENMKGIENDTGTQDATAAGETQDITMATAKKKKKKSKSKSKRGLTAPTGFEEFYVDAPLTLAEHEEEQGLYDPRIEVAIQRFNARRKMDPLRKDVFDKYMKFGGISAGPKQFGGGLTARDMSDMDTADIALAKATHFVELEKFGEEAYEVDFEACVKAFFSSIMPSIYDLTGVDGEKNIRFKTNVIRNFLNYLLHHDVCQEYKDQIYAARNICDLADKELPMTMRAQSFFPGDFQTACSQIFGGSCSGRFAQNPGWATELETDFAMHPDLARQTFKIGLATQTSDELSKTYMEQSNALDIQTTKVNDIALEVTELLPASSEVKKFYEKHEAAKGLKSLGRLKVKTWRPPHAMPQDLTEEEELAEADSEKPTETYEFLVEDYVLDDCFVGMKFEATVRQLSFGLKFFDAFTGVYCSFYDILPNELVSHWKKPEDEPLPMKKKNTMTQVTLDSHDVGEEGMEDVERLEQGGEAENGEDAWPED